MATHFYPLQVCDLRRETADCVSIAFAVPAALRETFAFVPGQHITLRTNIGEIEVRRSYSLCSTPESGEWRVAVKRVDGGQFSQWANALLRAGDLVDVMPPDGRFVFQPDASQRRHIVLMAAGSGITPMLSILSALLHREPLSRVTLVYGNRRVRDIIFKEQIEDLRDAFLTRFQLIHTLSGEPQEAPLASGRLDGDKVRQLFAQVIDPSGVDAVYLCGPNEMIEQCAAACIEAGIAENAVHKELFGAPAPRRAASDQPNASAVSADTAAVTVTADGISRTLQVPLRGESILDIALAAGIDAPYACKAGVCCTCRARVTEGTVRMDANFTLEQDEVARGFVLTCQAHPTSTAVELSFDAR